MSNPSKFRAKPVVIEAMQFTEEYKDRVFHWITCNKAARFNDNEEPYIAIQTLEGTMVANLGDWIIKGTRGEFYPCKPDVFERKYEPYVES